MDILLPDCKYLFLNNVQFKFAVSMERHQSTSQKYSIEQLTSMLLIVFDQLAHHYY